MGNNKSELLIDLRIYDPTEPDSRKGTQIKLKKAKLDEITIKDILVKYFG